jgi:hypothetical protein
VNEAFNKVTKEKLSQLGGLKHCWRIDKLMFHLMDTILKSHVMKMQMTLSGALKDVASDWQHHITGMQQNKRTALQVPQQTKRRKNKACGLGVPHRKF